jgi:hypothetical protein
MTDVETIKRSAAAMRDLRYADAQHGFTARARQLP